MTDGGVGCFVMKDGGDGCGVVRDIGNGCSEVTDDNGVNGGDRYLVSGGDCQFRQ